MPKFLLSCQVSVGSPHQRQGNSETWQCQYGGSGNDLLFTWKEALDNWVEYKKLCNTASGWTGVGEPSQEEFGSQVVSSHLCPKAPALFKALQAQWSCRWFLPIRGDWRGSSLPAGMGGVGHPAPPQQGTGDSRGDS